MIKCINCNVKVKEYPYHYKCPKCKRVLFLDTGEGNLKITSDDISYEAQLIMSRFEELVDSFDKRIERVEMGLLRVINAEKGITG